MPLLDPSELRWNVKRLALSKGDLGVEETIDQMRLLVAEAPKFPELKALATKISQGVPPGDSLSLFNRLQTWSKYRVQYLFDSPVFEEVTGVGLMLERLQKYGSIAGDCDCVSIFQASLARALNLPVRFVTIATGKRGIDFTHVFPEVYAGGAWRSLDVFAPRAMRVRTRYWRI